MDDFSSTNTSSNPQLARPIPRRPGANFSLQPLSTTSIPSTSDLPSSEPPSAGTESNLLSPSFGSNNTSRRSSGINLTNGGAATPSSSSNPPQRNRSILNLTSSTLFGIYSPTGYDANREAPETPWGTGALTPAHRPSTDSNASFFNADLLRERALASFSSQKPPAPRPSKARSLSHSSHRPPRMRKVTVFGVVVRSTLLFAIGLAYGGLVSHFHDKRNLAPVKVDRLDRSDWRYYLFWGVVAVLLGSLMPAVDRAWDAHISQTASGGRSAVHSPVHEKESLFKDDSDSDDEHESRDSVAGDWIAVFRTIGAFVGIAFAIRRLPWQSTLQLSASLALINPALWYLLDRTLTGLALSAAVGIIGAGTVLGINPNLVPRPPARGSLSLGAASPMASAQDTWLSYEAVGVVTWIGSVLFCACVCFGNIGRRVGL